MAVTKEKSARFGMRLRPRTKELIRMASRASEMTMSTWAAEVLHREARHQLLPPDEEDETDSRR